MLDYKLKEIEQNIDFWENIIHPDDKNEIEVFSKTLSFDHQKMYEIEYRLLTKSGNWKWILCIGKIFKKMKMEIH